MSAGPKNLRQNEAHKIMRYNWIAGLIFLSCFAATAFADDPPTATGNQPSPYVQESIGVKVQPPTVAKPILFPDLPVSMWTGRNFVFQPVQKSLQHYGYQDFTPGESNSAAEPPVPLAYNNFVGRVGQVTNVVKDGICWHVTLRMTDDGNYYTTSAYDGIVENLAPAEDIDTARQLWKGKMLWFVNGVLATYNVQTDKSSYFTVKKYRQILITDIVASWDTDSPIRFICKAEDGRVGFVDVHLSNTNVADILRKYAKFSDTFLTSDPRKNHPWDDKIWNAIEDGKLVSGMTQLQAKMAWHSPPQIVYKHTPAGLIAQWCGYTSKKSYVFLNDRLELAK
jgi:hypothetical protein